MRKRHLIAPLALLAATGLSLSSCQEKQALEVKNQISGEVLEQIQAHGYSTADVKKVDDGYLVEGDILLSREDLANQPEKNTLPVGADEQYWSGRKIARKGDVRTIKVRVKGFANTSPTGQTYSRLLDEVVRRYNDVDRTKKLYIRFAQTSSGDESADITITPISSLGGSLGSARFPSKDGKPGSRIVIAQKDLEKKYSDDDSGQGYGNFEGTVGLLAHEIGHTIGFRHTNFSTRAFCGGRGEGVDTKISFPVTGYPATQVTSIYLAGTDVDDGARNNSGVYGSAIYNKNSWMLACQFYNGKRPFSPTDIKSIVALYQK